MEENFLHCRTESSGADGGKKVALITGITGKNLAPTTTSQYYSSVAAGQDGSYLAEFLLDKGYTVHGIIRRSSSFNTARISHLYDDPKSHRQVSSISGLFGQIIYQLSQGKMILHYGDLIDGNCLVKIINETKPTEIYNLGAQSHVKVGLL